MLKVEFSFNASDQWPVLMVKVSVQWKGGIEVAGQLSREVALAVKIIDNWLIIQHGRQNHMVIPDQRLMIACFSLAEQGDCIIAVDNKQHMPGLNAARLPGIFIYSLQQFPYILFTE